MSDRELLEMAAKAAGWASWDWLTGTSAMNVYDAEGRHDTFDPLADDGDALRLAVYTGEPFVVRTRCVTTMGGLKEDFDPALAGDDLRAVRRIIVRAAAAIGEAML